jgi:hypothetical protein
MLQDSSVSLELQALQEELAMSRQHQSVIEEDNTQLQDMLNNVLLSQAVPKVTVPKVAVPKVAVPKVTESLDNDTIDDAIQTVLHSGTKTTKQILAVLDVASIGSLDKSIINSRLYTMASKKRVKKIVYPNIAAPSWAIQ